MQGVLYTTFIDILGSLKVSLHEACSSAKACLFMQRHVRESSEAY